MSNFNWYVVRAVAGQEKKVKNYIETEASRSSLIESIPEIKIPTEKIVEVKNGKRKEREKSLFPGYILVQADLSNGELLHLIKSTSGVLGFLGQNAGAATIPVPLRQSEVNRFLGAGTEEVVGEIVSPDLIFSKGEIVKVIDGPFAGFDGNVEEIAEDKKKLSVSVKIFGRSTPVELTYTQVEKI